MAYPYNFHSPSPSSSSGIRSRRIPHRPSLKPHQMVRHREELTDLSPVPTFIEKFEAGRSFDVEDDFAFIPELCTDEERLLMDSGSDRSSTSSGSPQSSPLGPSTYANLYPNMYKYQPSLSSSRTRNAIPIVNPSTGMRVSSPPLASPGRIGSHSFSRRAW